MMIEPVSETEATLRRAIADKLSTAALDCSWDCPEDCRTHHPSIAVSGWAPVDEPEDIDGTIEAIAHVAALAVQPEVDRLRELLAPAELTNWAEQLQSADLTPHPAFAWCSTTTGYEAAVQVATTDQLTAEARELLLAELQKAFDETVRRVLGYRPAGGAKAVAKADLGVLVSCYALSCPNGEYSRLAEQRGWTVHSLGMWCCPKHPAAALAAGQ